MYPIRQKSEFYKVFVDFCLLVENQFSFSIKTIRTNGGGEFSSKLLVDFLKTMGTLHQKSCPHTPEQNGVVERKHRHLVETGLTLLAQSHLPSSLWLEAFSTVIFLINRLPIVDHQITPFQILFNKPPDYFSGRLVANVILGFDLTLQINFSLEALNVSSLVTISIRKDISVGILALEKFICQGVFGLMSITFLIP